MSKYPAETVKHTFHIDEAIAQTSGKQRTYMTEHGPFTTRIINTLHPYEGIESMAEELYDEFNKHPEKIIEEIYQTAIEPIAITESMMNGAFEKLKNSTDIFFQEKRYHAVNNNVIIDSALGEDAHIAFIFNPRYMHHN